MADLTAHVVGRGIIGLSVAYELQKRGWHIFVVGPAQHSGSATGAATGLSSLRGQVATRSPLFTAKMRSHKLLATWLDEVATVSRVEIPCSFKGIVEPATDLKGFEGIRRKVFHRTWTGCLNVSLASASYLPFRPGSGPRGVHFTYHGDGWFDPEACLEALIGALARRGAQFCEQPVDKLCPSPGKNIEVVTPAGSFNAKTVVLAAGIFSDQILKNSGISIESQCPVEGETLVAELEQGEHGVDLPAGFRFDGYSLLLNGPRVRFGSSSRARPTLRDCGISPCEIEKLSKRAARLLPQPTDFVGKWGVRGRFFDRYPAIGPIRLPRFPTGLWLATGFYKNGLQLAPLFAQQLASMLSHEPSVFDPSPFLADRLLR